MSTAKKIERMTIEEFEATYLAPSYEGRAEFHAGEVWQAQATTPKHNDFQGAILEVLRSLFHKKPSPKKPGGWWILPECAVRYGNLNLFIHDLGGWLRTRSPTMPTDLPITLRPDWVCEILSTNKRNDRQKKRSVLHEHEVPFYWIADPEERSVEIFEWSEKGYILLNSVDEDFIGRLPPFDAIELKVSVLFGEEED
jgi:Uma2 family endonuclease